MAGAPERIVASDNPAVMAQAGIIVVAVKSGDTAAMANLIKDHAADDAVIVSLQNGVGNVALLREMLPGRQILGGMVPFNVVTHSDGIVHRATSGALVVERDAADTASHFAVPGLSITATDDIVGVQWGKLLLNLSNALNALSNLPLHTQLQQRAWRRLYADQMAEGLAVMRAAGIRPVSTTSIPAEWTPRLLRLPDGLFAVLLKYVMKIDANARSSMWEDLERRRTTEIDYLQGIVVELATRYQIPTPLCRRVMLLIKEAEASNSGSPGLSAQQVRGLA
ncbi:2-dehydropantoate 2-reductase [Tardiphaga alba]|uniref:2-dehydropantoate 2-reductase n=1 Tax=Tardiphaga alba TaxID=340268 RepID=UPI002E212717